MISAKPDFSVQDGLWSLRLLTQEDLPLTLEWRNHEGVRQCFFNQNIIKIDEHENWYKHYQTLLDDVVLIGERAGVPSAQLSVYKIDMENKTAELGRFIISPEHEGKGYMSCFFSMLIDTCRNYGLKTVYLHVLKNNLRAIKFYLRHGFEKTNLLTDQENNHLSELSAFKCVKTLL